MNIFINNYKYVYDVVMFTWRIDMEGKWSFVISMVAITLVPNLYTIWQVQLYDYTPVRSI